MSSTRLNPRLARLAFKLQHWLIQIVYLPGEQNTLADAISREERMPVDKPETPEELSTADEHLEEDVSSPGRPSCGGGCGGNASTEETTRN